MTKGYSLIGLHSPKTPANVGSALRAAGCFEAAGVFYTGRRINQLSKLMTDPQKTHRNIPLIQVPDIFDVIPSNCTPIAVDLTKDANNIVDFSHPKQAFYIFGPEDGTLDKSITSRCKETIYIPSKLCLNLAACVNVILYDRMMKQQYLSNILSEVNKSASLTLEQEYLYGTSDLDPTGFIDDILKDDHPSIAAKEESEL